MLFFSTPTLGRIDCVTCQRNHDCVWGKELGLLFHFSPLSVSLSFTFLKLFLYTQSVVHILYLVRVLYPVRSPWSSFYTDRLQKFLVETSWFDNIFIFLCLNHHDWCSYKPCGVSPLKSLCDNSDLQTSEYRIYYSNVKLTTINTGVALPAAVETLYEKENTAVCER